MARRTGLVISCEHASATVPDSVELGLPPDLLTGHLAWDPGAGAAAEDLARRTGAPLLMGEVSRLVVDLNRRADAPSVVPVRSFGHVVPGNVGLDSAQRQQRLARWHAPYRQALAAAVAAAIDAHGRCLHLSVHSFTAVLGEERRELDVGVLFDPARAAERAWAGLLLAGLRGARLDARANAPYLGVDDGCTTWLRGRYADPVYAGLELELSQALSASGQALAGAVVAGILCGS